MSTKAFEKKNLNIENLKKVVFRSPRHPCFPKLSLMKTRVM